MRFLCWFLLFFGLLACTPKSTYTTLTGQTMGTSYHITLELPNGVSSQALQASIDQRLAQINASMSTYQDDSTISRFNRLGVGEHIAIDEDFAKVLLDSRAIYHASGGSFDPTVYPLVELWGFGKSVSVERLQHPPSSDEIALAKHKIGLEKVVSVGNEIFKTADGVGLDFSAIAKGYGVDAVTLVLQGQGVSNYLVEIGGEIATLGVNDKGVAWTLAIDKPVMNSTVQNRQIMTMVELSGEAMATSGNYRNTLEWQGVRYSHTINPATAHPVINGAPSVSVIAQTAAIADGWATALTAIPADQALALANQNAIKAIFVIGEPDDLTLVYSDAYQARTPTK